MKTATQAFAERGIQQGMQQGRQEEQHEIAKNMLSLGLDTNNYI